jgi:hypothetical protein
MKKPIKKYDLDQCVIYKCRNKRKLEEYLLLKRYDLEHLDRLQKYHSFSISKEDGGKRDITAPNNKLKRIQRRLLYLLSPINRPDWLMSGERGKSYIDNAKRHLESDYFLVIDIRQFYSNCRREDVYRFFLDVMQTSIDVACKLTDLITMEGGIPTGAPTSQLIAYYSYGKMFEEIASLKGKICSARQIDATIFPEIERKVAIEDWKQQH